MLCECSLLLPKTLSCSNEPPLRYHSTDSPVTVKMPLSTLMSYKLTWGNSVFEHELATRMVGHGQFATVWHCGVTTGPNHSSHLTHPSHNTHKRSTKHSTYNGLSGMVDLYEYKHSRQAFKWSSTPLWAVRVNWKNMSTSHVSVQGSLSKTSIQHTGALVIEGSQNLKHSTEALTGSPKGVYIKSPWSLHTYTATIVS